MTPDSTRPPAPVPARGSRRDFLQHLIGIALLGPAGSKSLSAAAAAPGAAIPPAAEPGAAGPAGAPAPWEELSDPGWSQ